MSETLALFWGYVDFEKMMGLDGIALKHCVECGGGNGFWKEEVVNSDHA